MEKDECTVQHKQFYIPCALTKTSPLLYHKKDDM